jgi:hypothetical protein
MIVKILKNRLYDYCSDINTSIYTAFNCCFIKYSANMKEIAVLYYTIFGVSSSNC